MTILVVIGMVYCDHFRDAPWEDIFKLGALAVASEFCEWVHVGIDVYILHRKYKVKPHSSLWFSAACAAVTVHRNYSFPLYQKDKSSDSKLKFRQARGFLKLPNLHMLIKQKSPLRPTNLAVVNFGKLLIVFSTKVNLLTSSIQRPGGVVFFNPTKQNCLLKTFI